MCSSLGCKFLYLFASCFCACLLVSLLLSTLHSSSPPQVAVTVCRQDWDHIIMVEWGRLTKPFIHWVFFPVSCYVVHYFTVWLLVTVAVQTPKESAGPGDRLNCSLPSSHPWCRPMKWQHFHHQNYRSESKSCWEPIRNMLKQFVFTFLFFFSFNINWKSVRPLCFCVLRDQINVLLLY